MKKAVSPVIAIVLLLMMTVAAAGAAYFWLTSMQSTMQESAGSQIEQITEEAGGAFQIVFSNCSNTSVGETKPYVRIRNTGSVDIESESEVFAKLEQEGTSAAQGNDTIDNTLEPNDLSDPISFSMGDVDYNKDYTLSVSIGTIEKSTTVNCTQG